MSFFNDIFNEFKVDLDDRITLSYIENKGVHIVGKFEVLTFNNSIIKLKTRKNIFVIEGENFEIKTIAKGELMVVGKVFNIALGDQKHE